MSMHRREVDITQLKLLVAAGMSSQAIALGCNWSLQELRLVWANHCRISVFMLILFEQELKRLPTKYEVSLNRQGKGLDPGRVN